MLNGIGEPLTVMLEAVSTSFGWVVTVLLTLIAGFCLGYSNSKPICQIQSQPPASWRHFRDK